MLSVTNYLKISPAGPKTCPDDYTIEIKRDPARDPTHIRKLNRFIQEKCVLEEKKMCKCEKLCSLYQCVNRALPYVPYHAW